MSMLRMIITRCSVQSRAGRAPRTRPGYHGMPARLWALRTPPCPVCDPGGRDGELPGAVSVAEPLLEAAGGQGEMFWCCLKQFGAARGRSRSIPAPAACPSARGYPRWGSTTDGLASCKVVLYFIASFLP